MSSSNARQQQRQLLSELVLVTPFESPPPFFGGLPRTGVNKVPIDSVYGRLPRPAVITPPWRVSPQTTNEAAKAAYLSLHGGHFYGQWAYADKEFTMIVGATEDAPNPFSTDPLMKIDVWGELITVNQLQNIMGYDTLNEEFRAAFSIKNKTRLSHRLMHLYVRSHGAQVPQETMDHIYDILSEEYIRKQWYEGVLDISIIYVDVAINCGCHSVKEIVWKLHRIGETLESLGRFIEAAQLYKYTAKQPYCEDKEQRAILYGNAGLAFKRAEAYDAAEAEYVNALQALSANYGESWDINDDTSTNTFTNILLLYHNWGRETSSPGQVAVATDVEKMESAIVAILFLAGFKAKMGGCTQEMIREGGPFFKKLVEHGFRTRAGARGVLDKAAACTSVQGFRQECVSL